MWFLRLPRYTIIVAFIIIGIFVWSANLYPDSINRWLFWPHCCFVFLHATLLLVVDLCSWLLLILMLLPSSLHSHFFALMQLRLRRKRCFNQLWLLFFNLIFVFALKLFDIQSVHRLWILRPFNWIYKQLLTFFFILFMFLDGGQLLGFLLIIFTFCAHEYTQLVLIAANHANRSIKKCMGKIIRWT